MGNACDEACECFFLVFLLGLVPLSLILVSHCELNGEQGVNATFTIANQTSGGGKWPPRDPSQEKDPVLRSLSRQAHEYRKAMCKARVEIYRLDKATSSVHFQGTDIPVNPLTRVSHLRLKLRHLVLVHNEGRDMSPANARAIEQVLGRLKRDRLRLQRAIKDWNRAGVVTRGTYFSFHSLASRARH